MLDFEEYMPTELDDEMFLSDVPLGLLEDSITNQFKDPTEYRKKDYVQTFITRYEYTKEEILDTEEDEKLVEDIYDNFLEFMRKIFSSYLGIGFDNIEDKSEEDALEMIHVTYRFFMTNIRKNFIHLIYNYIKQHKEIIVQSVSDRQDVTAIAFTNEGVAEDDVAIISNLEEVIDYILSQPFTDDEFIELCETDKSCLETEFVRDAFDDFSITGNFVDKYISMVDDDLKSTLESKIRNKILKEYPNRKKKVADMVTPTVEEE